jgi:hypothetical protein
VLAIFHVLPCTDALWGIRWAKVIPLLTIAVPLAAPTQPITIENFQSLCSKKVPYFAPDAKGSWTKMGESLDGYCAGHLEGALAAMQQAKLACPDKDQTDVGFLLSVIHTYVKDAGLN